MTRHRHPARALVTGASSGIGAALAQRLAARGIETWLAARRVEKLEGVAAAIRSSGGRANVIALDVADISGTRSKLEQLDRDAGGIDLVVANAGIGGESGAIPVSECTWPDIESMIQVNLLGAIATLQPFVRPMLERGHGHLVGVSSISAEVPNPRCPPYGASKAAFTYYLESADMELRPKGIPVTVVHPGFVDTDLVVGATFDTPFMVPLDRATDLIDRGIQRRARMIRFPFGMAALSTIGRVVPRWIRGPVLRSAALKKTAPARGSRST